MNDFILLAASIFLEGLPFALMGGVLAATVDALLPSGFPEWVTRPRTKILQVGAGILGGFILPICECSNVPFVRRMLAKGLPPAVAVSFLFSAPLVNPVCLASTYLAFAGTGKPWMFLGLRLGVGLCIISILALWLSSGKGTGVFAVSEVHAGDSGHHSCGCSCGCSGHNTGTPQNMWQALAQGVFRWIHAATHDFVSVAFYLLIAALCVAAMQIFIDRASFLALMQNRVAAPVAAVGLAYILCLCSSVDAFVIAAFPGVSTGAKLAFLTAGPLFDFKLFWLYQSLFKRGTIIKIGLAVTFLAVAAAWVLEACLP